MSRLAEFADGGETSGQSCDWRREASSAISGSEPARVDQSNLIHVARETQLCQFRLEGLLNHPPGTPANEVV